MKKSKLFLSILGILIVICIILLITQCGSNEKKNNRSDKNSAVKSEILEEENIISKETVDLNNDKFPKETIGSDENLTSEDIVNSDKLPTAENITTSKKPTNSTKTTASNDSTTNTTINKTTSSNIPPVSEETTISGQMEKPEDSKFKVILTAPQIAMVDTDFDVSISTVNCAHIEWYINGEYKPELEKQISPKGTLKFSKAGLYRVTVIGYTEDWSENVSDTIAIQVYRNESQLNGNAKEHDRAMYSWSHNFIYESKESLLQKVMELTECNILYQEVASNASVNDVAEFLQRRGEHNQTVYYLCGNASWAIEKGATSMLKEVERAVNYNKAAGEYKFVGIQFDVEPYCLEDFEENAEEYMAIYVENSKIAYKAAHDAGLLVEICIPYWWESAYGFDEELEDLIANACDSVAVMNYYKKQKEIEHIESELELCKKYNKRIINITETIPAGQHGLTEDNTYYKDGIDAIENMWNTLDGFFQYEKLGYAYHYLDIIIELLGLE